MGKLKRAILLRFRTKVLVPVVAVMVLLLTVTTWLVNRRVTAQLQADAAQQLATAEVVFKNLQEFRAEQLLRRYRNVVIEPRFKAIAQLSDKSTSRRFLDDLIRENAADVVVLSTAGDAALTAAGDPRLKVQEFESACADAVDQAMNGQPKVDVVKNGDRLFDIVSFPIQVGEGIVGALTFGVKNSVAQEFNPLTHSELVLLSDGSILASTLRREDLQRVKEQLAQTAPLEPAKAPASGEEIVLSEGHFLSLAGALATEGGPHRISYLILSSYEKGLQALHETQRLILLVSALAILFGAAVVWFHVRKVTEPLQQLHDSVEAVSLGDLSRRIEVSSMDECGELAEVFNQMTENLKNSRAQLETTVETLKTTQAQLIQSEKLSGIGEFVAGVTHELNNPLTSVLGFSELLKQTSTDPNQRRHLDMIHKSAQRCQKIVQALLGFARRHQPERKAVCVNGLVEAALEILNYQLRTSNIEVTTRLDPNLPQAMVDPHQIQQVFVNIINNARQAIEAHQPKGWIKITTETCRPNVRVVIQDSGPGISQENLSKIFDPFFTTKEVGKGTGLGLSLCYGIIEEHGGTITPRSRPGEGATFVIELPVTHEAAETVAAERQSDTEFAQAREGVGKKVLVIDDEEPILQLMRETLTRRGYEVDTAPDGETGLRRVSQSRYDVMLCDWKMPGLNGREVYERLRAKNPAQSERMIFITGDVVNEKTRRFLDEEKKYCLPKPFSLSEFRAAIGRILAAA